MSFDGKEMLGHIVEYFQAECGRDLEYLTVAEVGPELAGRELTVEEMCWIHEQVVNGEPKRDDIIDFFKDYRIVIKEGHVYVEDSSRRPVVFIDSHDHLDEILDQIMAYEGAE